MKKLLLAVLTATLTLSLVCFGCEQSSNNESSNGETPPHTHTSSEWIIDEQPSCSKTGLQHKECTICNETLETNTIDAPTHEYENYVCKHCGNEYYTEGLQYKLLQDKTSYEVVGIDDATVTEIIIPSKHNDLPITIGENAFYDNKIIEKVYIHNGVISIGNYAFEYCDSLTSITIPDTITTIGEDAFEYCNNLKYNEYDNAYYLGNNNNPYLCLIKAKSTDITNCSINENCKFIYAFVFAYCSNLINITIPNSVTSIGEDAFYDCVSLKYNEYDNAYYLGDDTNPCLCLIKAKSTEIENCNINENCKFISSFAFSGCSSLEGITIPNSVTSIGDYAFEACSNLTNVYYMGAQDEWNKIEIENDNDYLTGATKYFYSETKPTTSGNFWHYVDGTPTVWSK